MSDDDIGTVRWFGESWRAPVNDPRARIKTPTGHHCIECGKWIEVNDQGLRIPAPEGYVVFHKQCFFKVMGVPHGDR